MQDLVALEGKTVAELREIAKVFGIVDEKLSKKDIIGRIMEAAGADENAEPSESVRPKRGRRPRMSGVKVENARKAAVPVETVAETVEPVADEQQADAPQDAQAVVAEEQPAAPKRRGRKPKAEQKPAETEPAVGGEPAVDAVAAPMTLPPKLWAKVCWR